MEMSDLLSVRSHAMAFLLSNRNRCTNFLCFDMEEFIHRLLEMIVARVHTNSSTYYNVYIHATHFTLLHIKTVKY